MTPTLTFTPTITPTNPATPTSPPASIFSNATFTYNGDGQRVKSVLTTNLATTTTYFVGAHYQVENGVVTKYYFAGAQRIAMRSSGTLYFMLGDHLGSTSLVTFANGNVVSEMRYKAWGEVRYASGNTPTKYQYTGQYSYASDFGLLFYNARWYDSSLGRFAQADSIVGGDRYAYVNNNPIRYTDPSGHIVSCEADEDCKEIRRTDKLGFDQAYDEAFSSYGIKLDGDMKSWTRERKHGVLMAASSVGRKLAQTTKETETGAEAFKNVYGAVHFTWGNCKPCEDKNGHASGAANYGWQSADGGYYKIGIASMVDDGGFRGMLHMVHELGHAYDYAKGDISDTMPDNVFTRDSLRPNGYWDNGVFFKADMALGYQMHPLTMDENGKSRGETFADIFVAWTFNAWNTDPANANAVTAAQGWMP